MKNIFYSVLLSMLLSSPAVAEPITVLGFDWGMTIEEMLSEADQRGYNCRDIGGPSKSSPHLLCEKGEQRYPKYELELYFEIATYIGLISFPCLTFDGCDYTDGEIAQHLVQNGVVETMTHNNGRGFKLNFDHGNGRSHREKFKYCGEGVEGDILCVDSGELYLIKKNVGKARPSVDKLK